MKQMNLGEMLDETCARYPDKKFLSYHDRHFSYEEVYHAVLVLGRRLQEYGVNRGDTVTIMLPNIPEFIVSYFAVLKLGAVAVTINVSSTPHELRYLLGNSDSRVLITTATAARRFEEIRNEAPLCRHMIVVDHDGGDFSLATALRHQAAPLDSPPIGIDDPAVMIYTSGLTGKPLGAVLTHQNLATQSVLLRDICDGGEEDKGLGLIPLYHSFGASVNMLMIIREGASLVLMDQFNLESIFKAIESERVTYFGAVPRLYLGMLLQPDAERYDLSSLRFCITGGSKMPPEHIPLFTEKFDVKLVEGYGLTEASPVCSVNRINMPNKLGSIGIPIPRVDARVVDDEGRDVPPNEPGELLIRGPNVMKGYYRDEKATAEVIRNGWLHTRDLARIDEDGYIFLTGLKKRMVITNGFNVYPREVEDILNTHPAVSRSRVTGKPDLMRGEIVTAQVIRREGPAPDEKEMIRHCRTYLSSYKCPREVEFVETLDESGTGV